MNLKSRFIIGIDLGTTNIALSYIDTEKNGLKTESFEIPQLTAAGEISGKTLFPAFCYLPKNGTVPAESLSLPWTSENDYACGVFARDAGSLIPDSFISSAKSWLCHSGVNRTDAMLPWGGAQDQKKISPVEASCRYLKHLKDAWNYKFRDALDADGVPCRMESQQIVITVPASFDDTARELTLEAADEAGFKSVILLEEPLAAFYDWINRNNYKNFMKPGESVLVVDVGGGTTDFSIIRLEENGLFVRTAAGEHLLLGGDNIDMAIARKIESAWNTHLSPYEWASLCQRAREAKEKLLSDGSLESADIVLLSRGSSIMGAMKKASLSRSMINEIIYEGFFPIPKPDAPEIPRRSGMKTMGLPYANEAAVTRQLLDFLRYTASLDKKTGIYRPDRILFNGGTVIPEGIRQRVKDCLARWFPGEPETEELKSSDLSLAVASGAAYYGAARRGAGVRIKSGTLHSYYVAVESATEKPSYVCVMPRGTDENCELRTDRTFILETNKTTVFPLHYSFTRTGKAGEMLDEDDSLLPLTKLITALKHSSPKNTLEVSLKAVLTETGILRLYLESVSKDYSWPLNFDIRASSADRNAVSMAATIDSGKLKKASDFVHEIFSARKSCPSMLKELEAILETPRRDWPLFVLRSLADTVLKVPLASLKTAELESRYLNLLGFCMRPGCGDPADDIRISALWKFWHHDKPQNLNQPQTASEWWIFWRRVSSGLRAGHQKSILNELLAKLCPRGLYAQRIKQGVQVRQEMWKCLGSLELIPAERKIYTGNILCSGTVRLSETDFWVLGRLGARRLFNADSSFTVYPETVAKWLKYMMGLKIQEREVLNQQVFAFSRMAALSGDRNIDLAPDMREDVKRYMKMHGAQEHWLIHLDKLIEDSAEEKAALFGDALPLGLKMQQS